MALLSREAILSAQDLKSEDVPVPEWGGTVRVRVMTGTERDALSAAVIGNDNKPDMSQWRLRLAAACIVGEDGSPMFAQDEIAQLGSKSAVALERVIRAAERLNAGGEEAIKAAEGN